MPIRALVLNLPGTSCTADTQRAISAHGIEADSCGLAALRTNPALLRNYKILAIPGGAVHGDAYGAGLLAAREIKAAMGTALHEFAASKKLVLGICNGFQILTWLGLIEGVRLAPNLDGSVATGPIDVALNSASCSPIARYLPTQMELPVNHREGRLIVEDMATYRSLEDNGRILLQYASYTGKPSRSSPWNPNGSVAGIAAVTNKAGNVIGMMPHPERSSWAHYHTRGWYGSKEEEIPEGYMIFRACVEYLRRTFPQRARQKASTGKEKE